MALPTNIFIGKAKASTPQTKKQFSTHKPWDQPVSSEAPASNKTDIIIATPPLAQELRPNSDQSQSTTKIKVSSNSDQSGIKPSLELDETQIKVRAQPRPQLRPKSVQTQTKVSSKISFSSVVGLQRRAILFVFDASKTSREKMTSPIALQILAEACQTTTMAAQVATRRLEKKGLLHRAEFKNGRGGWTRYELPDELFQELLQFETQTKVSSNPDQSEIKVRAQPRSEPRPSSPIVVVSSKSISTTNTGAGEEPCFVIPNELSGKVSRRQLSEFVTLGKITESDLQLSLDAFAYDLKNKLVSLKHSSNPIGLLIGAIKNNGSYNSAKYVEALKSELKPFIQEQREVTAEKAIQRTSKEWESFQKFKLETPEDYKLIESKVAQFGFSGAMLEEFTFLEFKKVILKIEEEPINPLRPPVSVSP